MFSVYHSHPFFRVPAKEGNFSSHLSRCQKGILCRRGLLPNPLLCYGVYLSLIFCRVSYCLEGKFQSNVKKLWWAHLLEIKVKIPSRYTTLQSRINGSLEYSTWQSGTNGVGGTYKRGSRIRATNSFDYRDNITHNHTWIINMRNEPWNTFWKRDFMFHILRRSKIGVCNEDVLVWCVQNIHKQGDLHSFNSIVPLWSIFSWVL